MASARGTGARQEKKVVATEKRKKKQVLGGGRGYRPTAPAVVEQSVGWGGRVGGGGWQAGRKRRAPSRGAMEAERARTAKCGGSVLVLAMGVGGRPRQVEARWGPLIGSWVHVEAVAFKSQVGPVSDAADRSVAAGRRAKMYGTSV